MATSGHDEARMVLHALLRRENDARQMQALMDEYQKPFPERDYQTIATLADALS